MKKYFILSGVVVLFLLLASNFSFNLGENYSFEKKVLETPSHYNSPDKNNEELQSATIESSFITEDSKSLEGEVVATGTDDLLVVEVESDTTTTTTTTLLNPVEEIIVDNLDYVEHATTATVESVVTTNRIDVGIMAGKVSELQLFEERMGKKADIVSTSVHWGNENSFPEDFGKVLKNTDTTLFIYWYAMDYNMSATGQETFHFEEILDGKWDDYIESFADDVLAYGDKVVIAPFEEVNGDWVYWNGIMGEYGSIDEYKATFRYLREKFRHVPNASFAWVVNQVSVPIIPENAISLYYPGDEYVDMVGINAFNFGTPWLSFDALIEDAVNEITKYNKPIYITSTASADGDKKSIWIQHLFDSKYFKSGSLKGFIWFNLNKEKNWLIWSDSASESIFKEKFLSQ